MCQILCIQHGTAFHLLGFDQVIMRKRSEESARSDMDSKITPARHDARSVLSLYDVTPLSIRLSSYQMRE